MTILFEKGIKTMNTNFTVMHNALPITVDRSIGFGYDALKSAYVNPGDVRMTYPILDIGDSQIETKEETTGIFKGCAGSTLLEMSRKISESLEVSGKYNLFSAKIKTEFTQETESEQEYIYCRYMGINIKQRQFLARGDEYRKYLNPVFKKDLEGPSALSPSDLFDRYGTHLITEAYLGGRIEASFSTKADKTQTKNSMKASIDAAYKDISIKPSVQYSEETKRIISQSNINIRIIGGQNPAITSIENFYEGYKSWVSSLNEGKNLEICHMPNEKSFIPLWELCDDAGRAEKLKTEFDKRLLAAEDSLLGCNKYVVDITFVSNSNASVAKNSCPEGYILVDKDLNKGAGGDFIYICYKLGSKAEAYRSFAMEISKDSLNPGVHVIKHQGHELPYYRQNHDLNKGAGGSFIYFNVTKEGKTAYSPVKRMDVVYDNEQLSKEWSAVCWMGTGEAADCNKTVHGSYIYIMYKREDI